MCHACLWLILSKYSCLSTLCKNELWSDWFIFKQTRRYNGHNHKYVCLRKARSRPEHTAAPPSRCDLNRRRWDKTHILAFSRSRSCSSEMTQKHELPGDVHLEQVEAKLLGPRWEVKFNGGGRSSSSSSCRWMQHFGDPQCRRKKSLNMYKICFNVN